MSEDVVLTYRSDNNSSNDDVEKQVKPIDENDRFYDKGIDCPVCFERFFKDDMYSLKKCPECRFCKNCIGEHLTAKIG